MDKKETVTGTGQSFSGSESSPEHPTEIKIPNRAESSTSWTQSVAATPSSPPNFISLDQLSEAANLMYNMNLIHEITVDSDFKFEVFAPPEDSLAKRIKDLMQKAFWDILRTSLESDPVDYTQALKLLEEAKESLLGLLTNTQTNHVLRAHIEAKLDLEQAKTQLAESGILDLEEYGKIVIDLMAKMCAPARDDEVAALRTMTDPIEVFKQAFKVLDLMRMDMANYTISRMRSTIRQQAVQFEKENFLKLLETQRQAGFDGLQATKIWLKGAFEKLTQKLTASQSNDRSNIPVPNLILAEAYISLLDIRCELQFPETLLMDKERVERLSHRLTVLVILASLILFVCTLLSQNFSLVAMNNQSGNQWQQLKATMRIHVMNLITLHIEESLIAGKGTNLAQLPSLCDVIFTQIKKDVTVWLNEFSSDLQPKMSVDQIKEKLDQVFNELPSHISRILTLGHPVYQTLYEKAHEFLRLTLQSTAPEKMQVPPGFGLFQEKSTAPVRLQTGLSKTPFVPESPRRDVASPINYDAIQIQLQPFEVDSLVAIATTFLPIATHNKFVHGNHYADIIQHFYSLNSQEQP